MYFLACVLLLSTAGVAGNLYSLHAWTVDGKDEKLEMYKGKVSLVVNVASECGYTDSNYRGLVELQRRFSHQGFTVLAFPCNQFGGQEPGSDSHIKNFVKTQYDITFPLFSKVDVKGKNVHPVFEFLSSETQKEPRWNFAKYLVGHNGQVIRFYDTVVEFADIANDIAETLRQPHVHSEF